MDRALLCPALHGEAVATALRNTAMSIFDEIGRFGALKTARRNSKAIREMNDLPPEIQKDIGWPARRHSQGGMRFQSAYWTSLR